LRTPIVLLHGATSSGRIWDSVRANLPVDYRVFAPTLAGHHGGPPLVGGDGGVVARLVDQMCHQLDQINVPDAHLVGNSLGGWVALELARRGRARSVLALSPAGAWRSPRDLRRLLGLFRGAGVLARVRHAPDLVRSRHVRRTLLRAMAEHADRMTARQVEEVFADMAGCAVLGDLLDGARQNGPIEPLRDPGCRVRILWGLHDRMLPFMRYGAPMLQAVPDSEFGFLTGVGHVPMIDDPRLVAETIRSFVEGGDEPSGPRAINPRSQFRVE
jgi:pimeloyl-ACP methyl ester carboxylesterase